MIRVRIIRTNRARWRSGPWEIQTKHAADARWMLSGPSHRSAKAAQRMLRNLLEQGNWGPAPYLEGEHAIAVGKEMKR